MSAEIQTSLFIITAEIAVVTTVAALLAAGTAWARGRARMKAARALRAAAERLPGEGEIVQKERALLGEFARAYLTQDENVLAGLPARLLALRQLHAEAPGGEAAADSPGVQALQVENASLRAQAEVLEQQRASASQQLEAALGTINALVQEYGRGQDVAPTAESLLQALSLAGAGGIAAVAAVAPPAEETLDLALEDQAVVEAQDEQPVLLEPVVVPAVAAPGSSADVDALLADVLGASAVEPALEVAPTVGGGAGSVAVTPPQQKGINDQALDLSVPVEPPPAHGPESAHDASIPPPGDAGQDELDELDIDALLDAELGRQARLLTPPSGAEDDLDLARTDAARGGK